MCAWVCGFIQSACVSGCGVQFPTIRSLQYCASNSISIWINMKKVDIPINNGLCHTTWNILYHFIRNFINVINNLLWFSTRRHVDPIRFDHEHSFSHKPSSTAFPCSCRTSAYSLLSSASPSTTAKLSENLETYLNTYVHRVRVRTSHYHSVLLVTSMLSAVALLLFSFKLCIWGNHWFQTRAHHHWFARILVWRDLHN